MDNQEKSKKELECDLLFIEGLLMLRARQIAPLVLEARMLQAALGAREEVKP
jgi:hypothetical protein